MPLTLAGEIVLLCLDDHTGKCVSPYADYAFNGAVISDLMLPGRLSYDQGFLRLDDSSPVGNPILDEALSALGKRKRRLCEWIRTCLVDHGRERLLEQMVTLRILERVEHKTLGLFMHRRYPACGGAVENEIRSRLRSIVSGNDHPARRDLVLLSLLHGGGLLKTFLSREECRRWQSRITELVNDEPVGAALAKVIRADEDTAAAAVMAAAIT